LQIRRSFRNLASKEHPDKGGDPERFRLVQQAYEVLSNAQKVRQLHSAGQNTRACY